MSLENPKYSSSQVMFSFMLTTEKKKNNERVFLKLNFHMRK